MEMFCAKCGTSNDEAANFCANCGYALPLSAQVVGAASDEEYYKAFIGPKNQDYYLHHFSSFDQRGKVRETWHWPSFFVTFYWLLYRKMWVNALLYFFLPYAFLIVVGILGLVAGSASAIPIALGYLAYMAGIFILLPMYANGIYYKHCKKVIADVRAKTPDTQRQLGELSGKGGTSSIVIILLLIFGFVAVIGILAAIAIPAYSDYTNKSRTAQAASIGRDATVSVSGFYNQYRMIPQSLEAAGFVATLPPSVKGISIDNQTGTISITMEGGALSGQSIRFVPSLDDREQLVWTCMSEEIRARYLPRDCQQPK